MITLTNVRKQFGRDIRDIAVKDVSLHVDRGEIYGIIGASGAGKSTVLRLMNLLETPDSGTVEIDGSVLTSLSTRQLREKRHVIGMIFQQFNLVANKTVYDNVVAPLKLAGRPRATHKERVLECLRFVGLESFKDKYPAQLSGGQKQRVAIARALANEPHVLLCDEPTSSLDPNTTAEVLDVLKSINERLGVTIVIVTHEMDVIKQVCDRVTVMADGSVYETMDLVPSGVPVIDNNPSWFVDQLKKAGETDA
ncbi:methionine ABC transporter ATP-binding protein [Exiguobacterium alkaliphilum]|uniref:Methionine ABC transporter ATP-binding protein n=1 Tax=Exiguobacterium alkaliphilum TaxID=1428684 RepID=A0ABT2KVS5_9BACL|nr:methionine ABC transporter ATP-binding protein [Exiguobacterium alkaliphilum]MCT4795049.1 methionine ABC transporter ATP-binding protein [Exiguobacterium alkaliphilum]